MSFDNYFEIVLTLLSGGIIGAFINGVWANHTAKHKRKADHLHNQTEQLYGIG